MSQAVSPEQQEIREGANLHFWAPGHYGVGMNQGQLHSALCRGRTQGRGGLEEKSLVPPKWRGSLRPDLKTQLSLPLPCCAPSTWACFPQSGLCFGYSLYQESHCPVHLYG